MSDSKHSTHITVYVLMLVLVTLVLFAMTAKDYIDRHQFATALIQETGGVSAQYSGALSSFSAVQLWIVTYSEKPAEVFACVGGLDTFVCQPYEVKP